MEATKPIVTLDDVQCVAPEVERRLDASFFDVRFERVSNVERQALRIMADFPGDSVSVAEVVPYGTSSQCVFSHSCVLN